MGGNLYNEGSGNVLTTDEATRLAKLASQLVPLAREAAAMLEMPQGERSRGDLELLVFPEWESITQGQLAQIALCLVRVEDLIETISRREHAEFRATITAASAGLANRLHPRSTGQPG
jgi:hypothetical protein